MNGRTLIFGDPHLTARRSFVNSAGAKRDGMPASLAIGLRDMTWICETAERLRPQRIINLGDTWDHPEPTNDEIAIAMLAHRRLAQVAPTYVLLGNHDITSQHAHHPTSLLQFIPGVTVLEAPTVVEGNLGFLPYPRAGAVMTAITEASRSVDDFFRAVEIALSTLVLDLRARGAEYLFGHVAVTGVNYNKDGYHPRYDVQLPGSALTGLRRSFFGHVHLRQTVPGEPLAMFIGATNRFRASDEGIQVGVTVVEDGEHVEFLANPGATEFFTLSPDDASRLLSADLSNTAVRVRGEVSCEAEAREAAELVAALRARGALGVHNDVTIRREEEQKAAAIEVEAGAFRGGDLRSLFDAYCEAKPDAIPEVDREAAFAMVQKIAAGAADGVA